LIGSWDTFLEMATNKKSPAKKDNLFLLTGEDDYSLKQFLRKWERSALEKYGEYNVIRYDFESKPVSELLGELNAPPFFGDGKRIFFIENFPPAPPSRAFAEKKKQEITALSEALADLSEESVVVLASPKPDKRISAYKKLLPLLAKIHSFPVWTKEYSGVLSSEGYSAATEWVLEQVALAGGKILPAAARFLIEYCGSNPWILSNEIEKLVLYSSESGRPISEDDIKHLSCPSDEMVNFAFSNAVQTGKKSEVFHVFHQLLSANTAPQAILGRDLIPTIRQLLQVSLAVETNASAKEAGVHPFVFNKLKNVASRFSSDRLMKAHRHLLTIDRESKTGQLPMTADRTNLFQLEVEKMLLELF